MHAALPTTALGWMTLIVLAPVAIILGLQSLAAILGFLFMLVGELVEFVMWLRLPKEKWEQRKAKQRAIAALTSLTKRIGR